LNEKFKFHQQLHHKQCKIKKKEKKDFRPGFMSEIEKEIKSLMVIVDIITHYNCINHFSGKHQGPGCSKYWIKLSTG
jgi:hypothetical protein